MTFGYFSRRHGLDVTSLNEGVGGILAGATWVGFGALGVGVLLPHVTWQAVSGHLSKAFHGRMRSNSATS
jgi:hypothetical protein